MRPRARSVPTGSAWRSSPRRCRRPRARGGTRPRRGRATGRAARDRSRAQTSPLPAAIALQELGQLEADPGDSPEGEIGARLLHRLVHLGAVPVGAVHPQAMAHLALPVDRVAVRAVRRAEQRATAGDATWAVRAAVVEDPQGAPLLGVGHVSELGVAGRRRARGLCDGGRRLGSRDGRVPREDQGDQHRRDGDACRGSRHCSDAHLACRFSGESGNVEPAGPRQDTDTSALTCGQCRSGMPISRCVGRMLGGVGLDQFGRSCADQEPDEGDRRWSVVTARAAVAPMPLA